MQRKYVSFIVAALMALAIPVQAATTFTATGSWTEVFGPGGEGSAGGTISATLTASGGWTVTLPQAVHQGVSGNPAPGIYVTNYVINPANRAKIVNSNGCTNLSFKNLTLTVTADKNNMPPTFTLTASATSDTGQVKMTLSGSGVVNLATYVPGAGGGMGGTMSAQITLTFAWPICHTDPVTKITETTAFFRGVVVEDGGLCCDYRFVYWQDGGKPISTDWKGPVKTGYPITYAASGLIPGTLYHCRAEVRNSVANYDPANVQDFVTTARIAISSTDGGSVAVPGEGTFLKAVGTVMPVEAKADAGWMFTGWTGTAVDAGLVADANAATTVVLKGDTTLKANFKIKIIWVSFHGTEAATANAATAGFIEAPDKAYTDLLKGAGYEVVRYVQTGTPDVNMLNTASLVIISRSVGSGSFQNAAATIWNTQVTAPLMNTGAYTLRKNRTGFYTGNTIPDTTGDVKLTAVVPNHPIFKGIALTDGTMDANFAGICLYPDGVTVARGISVITEPVDANGTILATVSAASAATGPAGAVMIAEWRAGALLKHDGGGLSDILAGPRMVFLTGSREAAGKNSEGTGMIDLSADGKQMFLNAVEYMISPVSENFDEARDFMVDGVEGTIWDGMLGLDEGQTANAINASVSRPGQLYLDSANGVWDAPWSPLGPFLYRNMLGDFVATVKVTDFAGTFAAQMFHNDCGLLARDPNGAAVNWVSMNYFPTWTAFIARNTVDGARAELGATAGIWTGVDTYALAAQYPYIQLERKGNDFYFRISSDGKNFLPLTDPGFKGIYNGTQTPLVVSRPDLPAMLQVGLMQCTYTADAGYAAFDDFTITR